MSSERPAISVADLSKFYRVYAKPSDRWKELFTGNQYHQRFYALRNVSFSVQKGETLGIIGQNGSGKSTLLKVLAGLVLPGAGRVETNGRISSVIELGTGFHREFTGRSNVFMNASLLGLSEEEIEQRFPSIVEFSELGDFIERPLKTYSSGMWVRLAFSIAISIDPDILLIDEALSVGDILFQQKCLKRLRQFQESGATIIFVSHDLAAVKKLCQRVILLDEGSMAYEGRPDDVTEFYVQQLSAKSKSGKNLKIESYLLGSQSSDKTYRRYGTKAAQIHSVELVDSSDTGVKRVLTGSKYRLKIAIEMQAAIPELTIGILIKDKYGNDIFGTNTYNHDVQLGPLEAGTTLDAQFTIPFNLAPGDYFLTVALHADQVHLETCYDWIENALHIEVLAHGSQFLGVANLPVKIDVRQVRGANVK